MTTQRSRSKSPPGEFAPRAAAGPAEPGAVARPIPLYVRPEARPIPLERMTADQQQAFRDIVGTLEHVTSELRRAGREPARPPERGSALADPHRASRLLFLSGDRGTGKSSVLVSLRDAFDDADGVVFRGFGAGDEEQFATRFQALRRRVVWLEPLDMEPLPPGTNLLTAVLVRIMAASEQLGWSASGSLVSTPPAGLRGLEEDPLDAFESFAHEAALAWQGNISERAARFDLDSFGVDLTRVERSRATLVTDLRRHLARLAAALTATGKADDPLFLLAVDDFDLNPASAVDLLRLLRMVTDPRLFVLVLGDLEVAETMLNLRIAGDFGRQAPRSELGDALPIPAEDLAAMARTLAAKGLRKLIPPRQRLQLQVPSFDEADRFLPAFGGAPPPGEVWPPLVVLLGRVKLDIDPAVATLCPDLHSFLTRRYPGSETAKGAPYPGRLLLHASTRHLADLWMALRDLPERKPRRDVVDILYEEAQRALREDTWLAPSNRERFLDALSRDDSGSVHFLSEGIETRWRHVAGRELQFEGNYGLDAVVLARFKEWMLVPRGLARNLDPGAFQLHDRAEGLLILLHDLLALRTPGKGSGAAPGASGIVGRRLVPDYLEIDWVVSRWSFEDGVGTSLTWPAPAWRSFYGWDLHRIAWEQACEELWALRLDGPSYSELVYLWIHLCCELMKGEADSPSIQQLVAGAMRVVASARRTAKASPPRPWLALADLAGTVLGDASPPWGARVQDSWSVALSCLVAPETGSLSSQVVPQAAPRLAEELARNARVKRSWKRNAFAIRRARSRRLARFLASESQGLFRALSVTWPRDLASRFADDAKDPGEELRRVLHANVDRRALLDFADSPSAITQLKLLAEKYLKSAGGRSVEGAREDPAFALLQLARDCAEHPLNSAELDLLPSHGEAELILAEVRRLAEA